MQELTPGRRVHKPRRNSLQNGLLRDLTEGEVAIELVARGAARRVGLHNLRNAARIASQLAQIAASAGVEFRIDDDHVGPPSIVVGPRTARLDHGAWMARRITSRILLVEDDVTLAGLLARAVEGHCHTEATALVPGRRIPASGQARRTVRAS